VVRNLVGCAESSATGSNGGGRLSITSRSAAPLLISPPTLQPLNLFQDPDKTNSMMRSQRYSHYLPLKRPSRTNSRAASLNKDAARSPPKEKEKEKDKDRERDRDRDRDKDRERDRDARRNSSANQTKRRSTMNSREAAYDEAEALRRAIEASKEDANVDHVDGTSRRAKRGRSDSEE
jgi:hypothetical protein